MNKAESTKPSKYDIMDDIEVPEYIQTSWQRTVNIMAQVMQLPAGLVMRTHPRTIEVFVSSQSPGNVYQAGELAPLDIGLYCETVMDTRQELLIPNALKNPHWDHNPDIKLGMISYCGLPLLWPNGKIFGTICVLDQKENHYSELYRALLTQFREVVQSGLHTIWENVQLTHMQQELLLARDKAETANRAKNTFLANMSHELRTPLNWILGYAQILQRDSAITTQQQHGLNVIEQGGNRLLNFIDDILDFAKVESGKIALYETDFNLPILLNNIDETIKTRARYKGIHFSSNVANTLPNIVHADEQRLRQILLNLLDNAIKFTDQGRVTLKVGVVKKQVSSKDLVSLSFKIEDTGIGISPKNFECIFEPFKQIADQKHQVKGTGLGLAISKILVELMNGQLCVSSQLNVGTQFWFELALPVVEYNKVPMTQQPIIGMKGESPKILVMDDNVDNQTVLFDLLSPLGFKVKLANDGREGLEKATQWQPDVIITDLIMPKMDGFEFTRQLRQSPILKEKVIIASSASVYEEDKQKSLDIGCDAFLPKPIQVKTLLEQLQKLLNLTWVYGDKTEEVVEEAAQMVFPPIVELEKFYELSLVGDLEELEEQTAILIESDAKLKPFVSKMQTFLKKYQVNKLKQWLEEAMTND